MDNGQGVNGQANGHQTGAGELLQELSACLNRMMELLQTTAGMIRPTSASTLPTVTATLSGIVRATEHAALQVLDEAEALQQDQRHLTSALDRLRAFVPAEPQDGPAALGEAATCAKSLSARAMKLMAAMEFQDLATQHIDRTVRAIDEARDRLHNVLVLFDIPHAAEPSGPVGPASCELGDPDQAHGARQALADQLLAEMK